MSGRSLAGSRAARDAAARALAIVLVFVSCASAAAAAYLELDLDARLERAVDVFVGEIVAIQGERRDDAPWTLVTFRVEAWVLVDGSAAGGGPEDRTLAFLGGAAAGVAPRQVAGFPDLAIGDRYLVASYGPDARGASPIVGVTQGLWLERDDAWRDPFGAALAVDAAGRVTLSEDGDPEAVWLSALRERLIELRGEP